MILLISKHSEHTTCLVIDWLWHKGAEHHRVNGANSFLDFSYTLDNNGSHTIGKKNSQSNLASCSVVWYRRWIEADFFYSRCDVEGLPGINSLMFDYVKKESGEIRKYFLGTLKFRHILSDFNFIQVNKLTVLDIARNCGLLIPTTLVTSKKEQLLSFLSAHHQAIVKNIADPTYVKYEDGFYATYTAIVNKQSVSTIPEVFFPSLIQEYIEKLYEIRVFYLDGQCYSMAIFSQENEKTKYDFRKYDYTNPNRNVPYQLPKEVEANIYRLMKELKLNCGSLDFIKTPLSDYYFLEVNPLGQFGMVSEPCNYFLEEMVCEWLIQKENNEKEQQKTKLVTVEAAY